MRSLSRFVVVRRWFVVAAWVVLAVVGGFAAPRATAALTYDFSLPGQPGYETNKTIAAAFGNGGDLSPILLVLTRPGPAAAPPIVAAVQGALPGSRITTYQDQPALARDGLGVIVVYPPPVPGGDAYAAALPALQQVAATHGATVTGKDALASEGGGGGADVLAETIFGGAGALIVLLLVFGSILAVMPLLIAAASILTTFLIVWGLTAVTDVSFIVQFLLALIGLGVAIDYALLIVTRWREERGNGLDNDDAVRAALRTAGRSVLFSGVTVAVSLAALIALPVPFLRSIGFTGLLIPVISVLASLTLLPALLSLCGPRLEWPHRRSASPESRLWRRVGATVVRHRWLSAIGATVVLLALAAPVLGLRLGQPTNASLASTGSTAGTAISAVDRSGIGAGLSTPVEILTTDPAGLRARVAAVDGAAAAITPAGWRHGDQAIVLAWTRADTSTGSGKKDAAGIRTVAENAGARVGGTPAQDADFAVATYGNAGWVVLIIVVVTFLLLARAWRSVVLPLKRCCSTSSRWPRRTG